MKSMLRVIFAGASVSFFGSMVIGTISVAAMQISITEGLRPAIYFSLGSIAGEVVYVRLLLVALNWLHKQERIFKIMEWLSVLIVLVLAVGSFKAAMGHHEAKNVLLSYTMHRFLLGLLMRALSPAAIPFWLGWSSVLYGRGVLHHKSGIYNGYMLGIGVGTFLAHCIFIFGGKLAVDKLDANQDVLNWVIGGFFSLAAIVQVWKILTKKDAVEQLHETTTLDPHEKL